MAHLRHDFNQKTHWNNQLFFTNQNDSLSSSLSSIRRKTWRCNLLKSFFIWKNFISYFFLFSLLFGEEEGRDEEAKARVCADTHISWWMVLTLNTWIDQRCVSLKICFKKKKRRRKKKQLSVGWCFNQKTICTCRISQECDGPHFVLDPNFIHSRYSPCLGIHFHSRPLNEPPNSIPFNCLSLCKWHANDMQMSDVIETKPAPHSEISGFLKIVFYSWILIFF